MLNRLTGRLTAGTLALVLMSGGAAQAQTQTRTPAQTRIGEWKVTDISRARWIDRTPNSAPAQQQRQKRPKRTLAVILIAIGGAVAGGWFGSVVEGSLCECDDRRPVGAAYGALVGGAAAGIIAYTVTR